MRNAARGPLPAAQGGGWGVVHAATRQDEGREAAGPRGARAAQAMRSLL